MWGFHLVPSEVTKQIIQSAKVFRDLVGCCRWAGRRPMYLQHGWAESLVATEGEEVIEVHSILLIAAGGCTA